MLSLRLGSALGSETPRLTPPQDHPQLEVNHAHAEHAHLPPEPFNTAVRDGTAGQKIRRILEAIKPEAAYFSEQDGRRGGILIVNVRDSSDVPVLAEPWFLTFNAEVQFRIAMTPEDLAKANLEELGKKWA